MLSDEHFKVLNYEADAQKVFPTTGIKGGVAIHYRDESRSFDAIGCFTAFNELNSILKKVQAKDTSSITDIIYNQNRFNLKELYKDYPHLKSVISSNGKERRLTSGCISYDCFHDVKESDDIKICGYADSNRVNKYINKKYIDTTEDTNLYKYKVIVPANNGSGAIGETLSTPLIGTPLIGTPLIGYTQTFIGFGRCDDESEAQNIMKYIKSKFARTMLGILKVTQNGKKPVWKYVPLQDFTSNSDIDRTSNSDIDWSQSISDIDRQLYKKYGLSQEEIDFIETHVKEMN